MKLIKLEKKKKKVAVAMLSITINYSDVFHK